MNHKNNVTIPDRINVTHYFFRMGLKIKHADAFWFYYQHLNWQLKPGQPVRNWKSLAFNWVCSFGKARPLKGKSILR